MSETDTSSETAPDASDGTTDGTTDAPTEAPPDAAQTPPPKRRRGAQRKRHLVIVESPAKAETIGRFLGDDYIVDASYGHIRDLPGKAEERPASLKGESWAELAVNVEKNFEPVYIIPRDKQEHVKRLRAELKNADKLLLATDEDREGESIGWHLTEVLAPDVPVERIVFHEITKEAIEEALRSPRQVDRDLVEAQESRRILDRLFGYSLSPVLWRKVQVGLSAGRVQSVAVRVLVQRERERAAFHRAAYWDAEALLAAENGRLPATLKRLGDQRLPTGRDFDASTGRLTADGVRLLDEDAITSIVAQLNAATPWTVSKVEASPMSKRPAAPFTTSTLQQDANRKLGFTARRTMQVAQSLYEGIDIGNVREGLITYMRTDSVTLSNQSLTEAQSLIAAQYGPEYANGPRHYRTRSRNAQEAHEAIRPTSLARSPDSMRSVLNRDQQRLYELIWQRTVASQMPDARLERTLVEIEAPLADGPAVFEARGRRVVFPGYLRAYQESSDDAAGDNDDERLLPGVAVGETVRPENIEPKRHETQPPARFTEASLVQKLEEDGLGRPSTYASILGTIQDRGYTFKQGNALVPTFVAYAVTSLLERHFGDLVDPEFTSGMEATLDAIARGETDSVSHLREFYHGIDSEQGLADRIEAEFPNIAFPMLELGTDPKDDQKVIVRIGRFGPYLQRGEGGTGNTVSLPPDLAPADLTIEQALELLNAKQEGPRELGHDPESKLEVLLLSGRFGPYVQLGPNPPPKTKKEDRPKRASVPPDAVLDDITLEDALIWLSLPRNLGTNPATGEDVIAASGRFGPFIQSGKESRSLADDDDIYAIELERALELLAEPKSSSFRRRAASRVLAELGDHPESGKPVRILDGRYGPYATDGETNASLPRGTAPEKVTLEQAMDFIAQRAAAPKRKRRTSKKTTAKKTSAKKTGARKATKKKTAAKKKPAAKKSAPSTPATGE